MYMYSHHKLTCTHSNRGVTVESVATPLAVVADRVSGALEAPAGARVAASGHARVDVSVAVARLTEAARLVGVAEVALVALTAVGTLVPTRTLALNLNTHET